MADANININVQTASLEQLNAEMQKLQAEIKKVAVGSKEFNTLSAEIRKIDGAIEGANKKLKALDVGQLVGDFAKVGAGVASATQLFKQFGSEGSQSNEEIQKALETTNTIIGASAIAEGVASAAKLAGVAATKIATGAQAAYAAVVGTSTGALRAFKLALAATGIGLIVILIGELIANWDNLTSTIKSSAEELEEFSKTAESTLLATETRFTETFAEIDKAIAGGGSFNESLEKRRKAYNDLLNGPGGLIALSEEANTKSASLAIELFNYEQKLRDQGLDEEAIAEDSKVKKLTETSDKATKISNDYLAKRRKAELDLIKLDKDAANERIANFEIEADKKRTFAKDNELELIRIEKDLQQKKLAEITKANKFTQQEIDKQQNAVDKAAQAEIDYFEKVQQQKLDAERQYLNDRAELLNVTYEERLAAIDANKSAELKTIKETSKSEAELNARTQSLNLKYSFERVKVVQEEETKKLELVRDNITKRLELEAKAAESVGDAEGVKRIQAALAQIRIDADKAISDAAVQAKLRLDELLAAKKITEDAYKKAVQDLTKINTDFKTDVTKSVTEGTESTVSKSVASLATKYEDTLDGFLKEIEIKGSDAEAKFIKSIVGKGKKEIQDATEEFTKGQNARKKEVAEATILGVNAEIAALEKITGLTEVEEEKKQKKILDLRVKAAKAQVDLANATNNEIEAASTKSAEKAIEDINKIVKAVQFAINALSSINQILQANNAIDQANFDARQARLSKEYSDKFALLDEETKTLDEQEDKKKKFATAEEKRRFELAKQRAQLEEEQAAQLAAIQEEQLRASAEAKIEQANINFALATGQIIVSTAQAIAESIAASPLTFGQPWASINAGLGAIQIAAAYQARQAAISEAEASLAGLGGSSAKSGGRISRAAGGIVQGGGSYNSDSIPTNLSNGEFVVNANATQKYLPLLSAINQQGLIAGQPTNMGGNFAGNDGMMEILTAIKDKMTEPSRAYVLSSDIESVKNKENYILRRSNVL